jgi:hypothetical protein
MCWSFAARIKARQGLARFGAFCEFMSDLARCTDFRLLSSTQLQSEDNDTQLDQINPVSRVYNKGFSRLYL